MSVSSTTSELSFTGNNSDATPYALTNLRFDDSSWLTAVQIDASGVETTLVEDTDYTIGGDGEAGTGTLTSITGSEIPATDTLRVTRNTPQTQLQDLTTTTKLPSATTEATLDKLCMMTQDLGRRVTDAEAITGPFESADSGVTLLDNEGGGKDLAIWDQTTLAYRRIRLANGAFIVVS